LPLDEIFAVFVVELWRLCFFFAPNKGLEWTELIGEARESAFSLPRLYFSLCIKDDIVDGSPNISVVILLSNYFKNFIQLIL